MMQRLTVIVLLTGLTATAGNATDWPYWRGPTSNGVAPAGPLPPLEWDESKNVVWKTRLPGRGHASPTVVGQRIYLATADEDAGNQVLLALDRSTGKIVWETSLRQNDQWPKIHAKNTHASSTVACDGQRLFVTLYSGESIYILCADLEGKVLWRHEIAPFQQKYPFGYAASPALYNDLVITAAESESETALVAYRAADGREVWRSQRPQNSSYSSAVVLNVAGRDQLLMCGGRQISGYDPGTGAELWTAEGAAKHTAGTVTADGNLVVASGGYPESETCCVDVNGSVQVLWRNKQKCYEQSVLIHAGHVYAINDAGIAFCWDAKTGAEQWKQRLGGPISSSPILVGDRIYISNERGTTFVMRATPDRYEQLAENQLGDDAFPTPTFLDGKIYARVGFGNGDEREEFLYCLGQP